MRKATLEWVLASIARCKTVDELRTGAYGLEPLSDDGLKTALAEHDDMIIMARATLNARGETDDQPQP